MPAPKPPLTRRLAWFAALWLGGVLAVGILAYLIKLAMGIA